MKKVCLVIGAGAGIGGNVAMRFARENYHVVLCRRKNRLGLDDMVQSIRDAGGSASGYLLNAIEEDEIEQRVAEIEANIGPIEVAVYNLGAQTGNKSLAQTSHKEFEQGWRLGTLGLFRLASTVIPLMTERGSGTLLVTSATAAFRGKSGQHSHAAAMGGRRLLCQTLNAEFAVQGIHVAHILIDGAVDSPDTLGEIMGSERFQQMRQERGLEQDGLILPDKIADTYWHVAQQHRSAWTFEMDLRAFSDTAWWN